jgi:hypothetical protein
MIRSALVLCAGLVVATCFACAPVPPAAPPAPPPAAPLCSAADPQSFVNAVQLLAANYTPPNGNNGPYQPPSGQSFPWSQAMRADLLNAFSNAPMFFRQHLCQLNGIYINANGCPNNDPNECGAQAMFSNSWGFRSRFDPDKGNTYIAISATLWAPGGGPAMAFRRYETELLRSFAGSAGASVYAARPDDSWMTVLAALAHETGHVQWVQTVRPPRPDATYDGKYDFSKLLACPYDGSDFFSSWNYDHRHASNHHPRFQPRNGWRAFGNRLNDDGQPIDHTNFPSLKDLEADSPPDSYYDLFQLYQPGQAWASLFAAQTPDEDFVETYVMAVLMGYQPGSKTFSGPLTSLPLRIPLYTGPGITRLRADVPHDVLLGHKEGLARKITCILPPPNP